MKLESLTPPSDDLNVILADFDAWLALGGATKITPELAQVARAALVSIIELEQGSRPAGHQ